MGRCVLAQATSEMERTGLSNAVVWKHKHMGLRVSAIKNPETETKRKESVKLKMEQET
jgi:hypothetical protein